MSEQLQGLRRYMASRGSQPWRASRSPVVVVASGKGGVGTSTITLLLGLTAARLGYSTLLIDTDELSGSLHRLAGVEAGHALDAIAHGAVSPSDAVLHVGPQLDLVAGGSAVQGELRPMMTVSDRRALLARCAPLAAGYDCVFLDAGASVSRVLAATSRPVQQMLLVSGCDAIAIAAAFAMVKAVEAQSRGIPVRAVFNRVDAPPAVSAFAHLATAVHRFLRRSIALAGFIPDAPRLGGGLPLSELLDSDALGAIEPVLRALLASPHAETAAPPAAANA
ncbi:MAG: P-loop NTPase [Gemmatimonadetes bacterium]|nr:P-loop NTPase [Gemmatimonadota bacterium]